MPRKPISRVEDVLNDATFIESLRWLGELNEPWMSIVPVQPSGFRAEINVRRVPALIAELLRGPNADNEAATLYAVSRWLRGQPRIFRPTSEQAESLGRVDVPFELKDYEQPYEAILVEVPYEPFRGVVCCRASQDVLLLAALAVSEGDMGVAICQKDGVSIDYFLQKMDDSLDPLRDAVVASERLAINAMLSLMSFGHKIEPAYPKAQAEDEALVRRGGDVGARASRRVGLALQQVGFTSPVVIRRSTPSSAIGPPTGRSTRPHWVRGHWKQQAYGPHMSLRKPKLIRPYLTHADVGAVPVGPVSVYVDRR